MRFSIIIALYNKEFFVRRALDSVLAQTLSDFEIIVANDGSTDCGVSVVKSYQDRRITIVSQSNQGPGAARNLGVEVARGAWLVFLDADDAWTPTHLFELARAIAVCECAGLVGTKSVQRSTADSSLASKRKFFAGGNRGVYEVDYFKHAARDPGFINSSSSAVRSSVFNELGGFRSLYSGEDTEFWARVCLHYPCVVSETQTAYYFRGTGGITENRVLPNTLGCPKSRTLTDVHPVIPLVLAHIEAGVRPHLNVQSLARYVNSKVSIEVRGAFYSNNVDLAKRLAELYLQPPHGEALVWSLLLLRLPRPVASSLARLRASMRAVYRRVRAVRS